jgi:hypothetical protein
MLIVDVVVPFPCCSTVGGLGSSVIEANPFRLNCPALFLMVICAACFGLERFAFLPG